MYTQVFEEAAKEMMTSHTSTSSQANPRTSDSLGESISEGISVSAPETENRVLYNYMFDRLLSRISPSVVTPPPLTPENCRNALNNNLLIKVEGSLRVGDYDFIQEVVEKWNKLTESFTHTHLFENGTSVDEYTDAIDEIANLRRKLFRAEDPNVAALIKKKIKSYDTLHDIFLEQEKMDMPSEVQKLLSLVIEIFYEGQFEANLSRDEDDEVGFRAPLVREHLRRDHDVLRSAYAGDWFGDGWTLVGSVALVPSGDFRVEDLKEIEIDEDPDSMRGGLKSFIRGLETIYRGAFQPENVVEIHLTPLAIYQEREIKVTD